MDKQQEKRSAKGAGTVRQRTDGRWEARCTINGKSRSFYADKQSEALKKMRAAQCAKDNGLYFEPRKITVGQWLDIWLEEYFSPTVRYATYVLRQGHIRNHITPFLGKIKLQSLNPTQIQTFYNELSNQKGLYSTTVRNIHSTLHYALDQAVKLRYITINPAKSCTLPRVEKKEISPLTEEEIKNFLQAIETETIKGSLKEPLKELFTVALFTGMREGEICGLSWDAVDFKAGTIIVKQQLRMGCTAGRPYSITPTKNGKTRTITPAPFVMDILKHTRQTQLKNHFNVGLAWENQWNLVFTDKLGHFLFPQTVLVHFKKIATKIGRPDARFHDLRHTYAVTALQEGDNPKTVQQTLGHASAAFTLNVYAHVSEKMKQESAARMQAYYENINA